MNISKNHNYATSDVKRLFMLRENRSLKFFYPHKRKLEISEGGVKLEVNLVFDGDVDSDASPSCVQATSTFACLDDSLGAPMFGSLDFGCRRSRKDGNLSRSVQEIQTHKRTNRQISSSCERYITLAIFLFTLLKTDPSKCSVRTSYRGCV